jgi:uncharacterized membrane protein YfbV (UPF0208 family)
MSDYTYDQYLETWKDHFGDDTLQGEFEFWHLGQRRAKILPKMSEAQFIDAVSKCDELGAEIDALQKRPDYATNDEVDHRVKQLLEQSFEYELPLFY